jgi:hypothetical protein
VARTRVVRRVPVDSEPVPLLDDAPSMVQHGDVSVPADWIKGALLNVRNHGAQYIVTLDPAEYDPRHEERCVKFTNVGECQSFVSSWYQREHCDPRAR